MKCEQEAVVWLCVSQMEDSRTWAAAAVQGHADPWTWKRAAWRPQVTKALSATVCFLASLPAGDCRAQGMFSCTASPVPPSSPSHNPPSFVPLPRVHPCSRFLSHVQAPSAENSPSASQPHQYKSGLGMGAGYLWLLSVTRAQGKRGSCSGTEGPTHPPWCTMGTASPVLCTALNPCAQPFSCVRYTAQPPATVPRLPLTPLRCKGAETM